MAKPVSVSGQWDSKLLIARPLSVHHSLGKRNAITSLAFLRGAADHRRDVAPRLLQPDLLLHERLVERVRLLLGLLLFTQDFLELLHLLLFADPPKRIGTDQVVVGANASHRVVSPSTVVVDPIGLHRVTDHPSARRSRRLLVEPAGLWRETRLAAVRSGEAPGGRIWRRRARDAMIRRRVQTAVLPVQAARPVLEPGGAKLGRTL